MRMVLILDESSVSTRKDTWNQMVKLSKYNLQSEIEIWVKGIYEILNNIVQDISSLFNEGLQLYKWKVLMRY